MANVSISTASKAFSMSPEVNEQTRKMIFNIAKKHGVFKKFYNAKYPRLVIGVICPEFEGQCYANAISTLQKELSARECEISVASSNFSADSSNKLFEYYCNYTNVDGIIIMDARSDQYSNEIPCVYMSENIPDAAKNEPNATFAHISCNSSDAILEGIKTFVDAGIYDIGYIGEPHSIRRFNFFKNAMHSLGIPFKNEYVVNDSARFEEGGYQGMMRLFERNTVPRAIFCCYDHIAIGAMRAIRERGLSVPDDIKLFAFDDISEAKYLNPSLSSVNTKMRERCALAASTVVNMITGEPYESEIRLRSEFIARESTM